MWGILKLIVLQPSEFLFIFKDGKKKKEEQSVVEIRGIFSSCQRFLEVKFPRQSISNWDQLKRKSIFVAMARLHAKCLDH